jgi:hypothetical protein
MVHTLFKSFSKIAVATTQFFPMEKYSKFTDSNGINPFVVYKRRMNTSILAWLISPLKFIVIMFLALFYWIPFVDRLILGVMIGVQDFTPRKRLIVANHSSYLDFVYFKRTGATILLGYRDKVYKTSLFKLLTSGEYVPTDSELFNLEELMQKESNCNFVLFPEGCLENGKAILKFQDCLGRVGDYQLVGLKYDYKDYSLCYAYGPIFPHFWGILKYGGKLLVSETTEIGPDPRKTLCKLTGLNPVSKTLDDKLEFMNYYNEKSKKIS